ncbi:MAG: hypothetical protein LBV42_02770 [Methanobrevibacter sp.]|jgi:hypothetical protein|nr:hypothetical protein [Methanobrevibacter sp.]
MVKEPTKEEFLALLAKSKKASSERKPLHATKRETELISMVAKHEAKKCFDEINKIF